MKILLFPIIQEHTLRRVAGMDQGSQSVAALAIHLLELGCAVGEAVGVEKECDQSERGEL